VAETVMRSSHLRHWPVVQNRWLVGMLALRDVSTKQSDLRAGAVMHEAPVHLRPTDELETAAQLMIHHRLTCVPVISRERELVGVVTLDRMVELAAELIQRDDRSRGVETPISKIMTQVPLVSVQVLDRLDVAQGIMRSYGIRHLPVLRGSRLQGILCERDMLQILNSTVEAPSNILVGEVMTPSPRIVPPERNARSAAAEMVRSHIGALLVCKGDSLVGIVSKTDFLHYLLQGSQRVLRS
jgi:CBS domain-containing protein